MACRARKCAQLCSGVSLVTSLRHGERSSPRKGPHACVCALNMGGYLSEAGGYHLLTLHIINTFQSYYSEKCMCVVHLLTARESKSWCVTKRTGV